MQGARSIPERAVEFFQMGYNCSQAVAAAFAEKMGMTVEQAVKCTSALGGGLCRMRETCGAVSGGMAALGAIAGYADPGDAAAKQRLYARGQRVLLAFREAHGSLCCRELLRLPRDETPCPIPTPRTAAFYASRPCARLIYDMARLVEEELAREEPEKG